MTLGLCPFGEDMNTSQIRRLMAYMNVSLNETLILLGGVVIMTHKSGLLFYYKSVSALSNTYIGEKAFFKAE